MADRRLQVFHTVARLLSFTKAADTLHMTQPAVTFQIRQLEEYFNTRLFDRSHNRISLTEAGERVLEYADQIINLYNEMDYQVRELTGDVTGLLVIGASTTIAEYVLPSLLGQFRRMFPNVKLRLNVSNSMGVVHMVEANQIDVGIVESPVGNKNLAVEVCWQDDMVVIAPPDHPLAAKKSATVDDIRGSMFLCREEGSGTREVFIDYIGERGHSMDELDLGMELGSPEAVKSAVEAGLGVSVVSEATVEKERRLGSIAVIPLDPPLKRPFSLVYQRQKFRLKAMEEFLEFAHNLCSEYRENDNS